MLVFVTAKFDFKVDFFQFGHVFETYKYIPWQSEFFDKTNNGQNNENVSNVDAKTLNDVILKSEETKMQMVENESKKS